MEILFYLAILFILFMNIICLKDSRRHVDQALYYKANPEEPVDSKFIFYGMYVMFEFICYLIGLMSSQGLLFLIPISMVLLGMLFPVKVIRNKFFLYSINTLDILVLIFVILNKFQFHIDLIKLWIPS